MNETSFSGYGRTIVVRGATGQLVDKLTADGYASHRNANLRALNGVRGVIRSNAAATCWFIDIRPDGELITVFSGEWRSIPSLNTTNGAGHWISLCTPRLAKERLERSAKSDKPMHPARAETLRKIAEAK